MIPSILHHFLSICFRSTHYDILFNRGIVKGGGHAVCGGGSGAQHADSGGGGGGSGLVDPQLAARDGTPFTIPHPHGYGRQRNLTQISNAAGQLTQFHSSHVHLWGQIILALRVSLVKAILLAKCDIISLLCPSVTLYFFGIFARSFGNHYHCPLPNDQYKTFFTSLPLR